MKEYDIHYIIEQQDYENKKKAWEKLSKRLSEMFPQIVNAEKEIDSGCKLNCNKQKEKK